MRRKKAGCLWCHVTFLHVVSYNKHLKEVHFSGEGDS